MFQKIINTFYIAETAREGGSLAHYRTVLHRTNVNGQVKANGYESHKDFLITVTRFDILIRITYTVLMSFKFISTVVLCFSMD